MNTRSGIKREILCELPVAKRSKLVLSDDEDDIHIAFEKRSKSTNVKDLLTTPPTTPQKQRIRDISNELLSGSRGKKLSMMLTPPATPTKAKNTSVYLKTKAIFQRGNYEMNKDSASCLVARESEGNYLNQFLIDNIKNKTCNSLYICGPPGTGKTAQVNLSFNHLIGEVGKMVDESVFIHGTERVKILKINCMSVNNPDYIFHEIYCGLDPSANLGSSHRKRNYDDLLELLTRKTPKYSSTIVLLDEMDYLITKDQQVLFQLFNFASLKNTGILTNKLILIGISNALDLTDKFLPRLKRNCLNPESLQFLPYTAEQIKSVIINKLQLLMENNKENQVQSIPIIHPAAIHLCSKKSASITGDLRKAFDICYKSIEIVENNLRQTKSISEINSLTFENAPKVQISHVAKVCSTSFGDNSLTKLKNLNLLQKAVLCCLFNYQIHNMSRNDINVNTFFDHYTKYSEDNIDKLLGRLKKGEFLEILSALESGSVIVLSDSKILKKSHIFNLDMGNKTIRTNVPYDDLVKSIGDIGVLKKILHGPSLM